jgi:hypothetical protein
MISSRAQFFLSFSLMVSIVACNRDDKGISGDSAIAVEAKPSQPVAAAINPGWDSVQAGNAMLLANADNMATAAVVLPYLTDSSLIATPSFVLDQYSGTQFELFGASGLNATATLVVNSQSSGTEGCAAWPAGNLSPVPQKSWRAGFRKGAARGLPLDSIQGMSQADSSFITSEAIRLATASAEGDDPAFRGLRFAAQRLYRFRVGELTVVVADVVRKINEEANPREEHVLIVAEQSAPSTGYSLAFQSRVAGSEDVLRTNEVLAAVKFTRGHPAIVLTFEYEAGGKTALLERVANQQWKITWRSAFTGC